MNQGLINYVLPKEVLTYFEVERVEHETPEGALYPEQTSLYIHLKEKNHLHSVKEPDQWESKDFTKPKTIQDFPLRARNVYWVIRFRRWRHKQDKGKTMQNNYAFLAANTRLSAELSAFLKSRSGY